jgi:hypothetical protein
MKLRNPLNLLALDLDVGSLSINLQALLLLWLMESFSLSQLLAVAALVALAALRSLKSS